MKIKIMFLCAVFLMTHAVGYGQKTEVRVQRGKIAAQTEGGEVTVEAGRKVVLAQDENPTVTVDDPLVESVMQMYEWTKEETANDPNIRMTSIQVHNLISEECATVAALLEMPNPKNEPNDIVRLGKTTQLGDVKFYDLDGNLLGFDFEDLGGGYAYYYIHFKQLVNPGELFKLVIVSKLNKRIAHRSFDNIYTINAGNCSPRCLNYFRIILPKSAIFLDCSRELTSVDCFDGRVALTFRNFTGSDSDGMYQIRFLWSDKDGTELQEIPLGFRDYDSDERKWAELDRLSWTDPSEEILEVYDAFPRSKIGSPKRWVVLGLKLVAGDYLEKAFDCFQHYESLDDNAEGTYYFTALVWQGHIYDMLGNREQAIAKYEQALRVENPGFMRHDQWGIVIDGTWVKDRLEVAFTKEMLGK